MLNNRLPVLICRTAAPTQENKYHLKHALRRVCGFSLKSITVHIIDLNCFAFVQVIFCVLVNLFELTDSIVRDCSGIGKQSPRDVVECRKAVSLLGLYSGKTFLEGSWDSHPKGCSSSEVWETNRWNSHQTGRENSDYFVICRKTGRCSLSYCTVVYKLK